MRRRAIASSRRLPCSREFIVTSESGHELQSNLLAVAEVLKSAKLPWALYAGCAAVAYGATRVVTDIDIVIASQAVPNLLVETFVDAQRIRRDKVLVGRADVRARSIRFPCVDRRERCWVFDEVVVERIQQKVIFGSQYPVVPPEDVIVIKSLMQRDEAGKHDVEDVCRDASLHESGCRLLG